MIVCLQLLLSVSDAPKGLWTSSVRFVLFAIANSRALAAIDPQCGAARRGACLAYNLRSAVRAMQRTPHECTDSKAKHVCGSVGRAFPPSIQISGAFWFGDSVAPQGYAQRKADQSFWGTDLIFQLGRQVREDLLVKLRTRCMLHVVCCTLYVHVAYCKVHVACRMLHVVCCTLRRFAKPACPAALPHLPRTWPQSVVHFCTAPARVPFPAQTHPNCHDLRLATFGPVSAQMWRR